MKKHPYRQPCIDCINILPTGGMLTASGEKHTESTDHTDPLEDGTELRSRGHHDVWEWEDTEDEEL